MKKYIKPELIYENFELTHHIAGNCSVIMDSKVALDPLYCEGISQAQGTVGTPVFVEFPVCDDLPVGKDDYCYTVSDSLWVSHVS